ncbi:hypothetical protein, partial [Psychrobacter sp.]|uniref:hypothetical protein n=1 Tax=Psychrobacter sp. TaxID=56811 RepID=UPI0025E5BDAA
MAKDSKLIGHELRASKRQKLKAAIEKKAENIANTYFLNNDVTAGELSEHYQNIDKKLSSDFTTHTTYRIARQGFLKAVRKFNKENDCNLDEPVVPILATRDSLTIDNNWFVEGSKVADTWLEAIKKWENKLKFNANDYVSYFIYTSIMFGGLNDLKALEALYNWLFTDRKLYAINTPDRNQNNDNISITNINVVIPLEIKDEKYGCKQHDHESLTHYISYVVDDVSLLFLYLLKDVDLNKRKIQTFDKTIKQLINTHNLSCQDPNKLHLSHLLRYANFNWRQLPGSSIDGATSQVLLGQLKSTSIPTEQ